MYWLVIRDEIYLHEDINLQFRTEYVLTFKLT